MSTKAKTLVAKNKAQAKPASKTVVKSAAKTSKHTAAKKPSVKVAATAKTKPVVKAKPTSKPVVKALVKPVTKSKPVVKAPVASKSKAVAKTKPTTKPAPKTKPAVKVAVKTVAKPAKPLAQKTAMPKPAAVKAVKTTPVAKTPKVKPQAPVPAPKASEKSPVAPKAKAPAGPVLTLVPSSTPKSVPTASAPPVKPRVSSRLAQLTVPSMAQAVASTAAKASYSQAQTVTLIVPPLPSSIKKDPKLANNWKTKSADQLSDAELMAMPDGEYMNEKQLAAFRHRLELLKRDMLANAGETTEHLREDTVVVPDPADRATIEEEHALELRTRDRERKLLKKIEQSIALIDAGEYGYCDETGEPIGVGRLLARPTATLSLEAQQRRELKQKMFGD